MSKVDKYLVAPDDPILKSVCRDVRAGENISKICDIMESVCKRGSRRGVGIAAPQVGHAIRLIFTNCKDERGNVVGRFLINPVIMLSSTDMNAEEINVDAESCLSYPGKSKWIARPDWIEVRYLTLERRSRDFRAYRFHARVLCHEIQHLDGICRVGDDSPNDGKHRTDPLPRPKLAMASLVTAANVLHGASR